MDTVAQWVTEVVASQEDEHGVFGSSRYPLGLMANVENWSLLI